MKVLSVPAKMITHAAMPGTQKMREHECAVAALRMSHILGLCSECGWELVYERGAWTCKNPECDLTLETEMMGMVD